MKKIKYGIIGSSGKMGIEIEKLFLEDGHKCVFKYDIDGEWKEETPELLIDFSLPIVFEKVIEYTNNFSVPLVIGTTGLKEEHFQTLKDLSKKYPIIQSYNFSIGIQLLLKCIDSIKDEITNWDIEIEETHHRFKKDKPSGTALMIKNHLSNEINISSLRLGNVPGIHTVQFGNLGEILKIEHQALSRRAFADGVLKAAKFIINKKNGLFSFYDVIKNNND